MDARFEATDALSLALFAALDLVIPSSCIPVTIENDLQVALILS